MSPTDGASSPAPGWERPTGSPGTRSRPPPSPSRPRRVRSAPAVPVPGAGTSAGRRPCERERSPRRKRPRHADRRWRSCPSSARPFPGPEPGIRDSAGPVRRGRPRRRIGAVFGLVRDELTFTDRPLGADGENYVFGIRSLVPTHGPRPDRAPARARPVARAGTRRQGPLTPVRLRHRRATGGPAFFFGPPERPPARGPLSDRRPAGRSSQLLDLSMIACALSLVISVVPTTVLRFTVLAQSTRMLLARSSASLAPVG